MVSSKSIYPAVLLVKFVCIDDKLSKPVILYKGRNAVNRFKAAILNWYEYCRSVMKKHINKNLVMTG